MIDWSSLPSSVNKRNLYNALREILTPENYNNGNWTLTELVMSSDNRAAMAFKVLDGLDAAGKRSPGVFGPRVDFRFEVLSRQACCKDKNGKKIWFKSASLEESDTEDDIVSKPEDLPEIGDVVEWKGNAKESDENGQPIDAKVMRRWAYMGIRPEEYFEFKIDKDGCITVPYPWAHSMLNKYGEKVSKPKFRRKSKRTITNWFFREVNHDFKKRRRSSNVTPITTPNEGLHSPNGEA